jgi:hypothetical protein
MRIGDQARYNEPRDIRRAVEDFVLPVTGTFRCNVFVTGAPAMQDDGS